MGVPCALVSILLEEGVVRPFSGEILQLGRQEIFIDDVQLQDKSKRIGYPLQQIPQEPPVVSKFYNSKQIISDSYFFKRLGFSKVRSLDHSDFEGADIIHDLNNTPVADELKERFDVILDGGLIEHVFHLPNTLKNIFDMLKVGGRVIHISPSSNYLEHGFYSFSPCFFNNYYTANGFEINQALLGKSLHSNPYTPWKVTDCKPGAPALNALKPGVNDNKQYGVIFIATKTSKAQSEQIPQQGFYETIWKKRPGASNEHSGGMGLLKNAYQTLIDFPGIGPYIEDCRARFPQRFKVSWRKIE